jgi:hypothetical protein
MKEIQRTLWGAIRSTVVFVPFAKLIVTDFVTHIVTLHADEATLSTLVLSSKYAVATIPLAGQVIARQITLLVHSEFQETPRGAFRLSATYTHGVVVVALCGVASFLTHCVSLHDRRAPW